MTLEDALPTILAFEGGKVDDPADLGGRTAYGITQRTFDAWRRDQKPSQPSLDVWLITTQECEAIYRQRYWQIISGDDLAALSGKLALCVFDGAVNHGVGLSSRLLQRVVGTTQDGVIGPQTIACVEKEITARGENAVVSAYLERRKAVYENIIQAKPEQAKFRNGWRHRLAMLCTKVSVPNVWLGNDQPA